MVAIARLVYHIAIFSALLPISYCIVNKKVSKLVTNIFIFLAFSFLADTANLIYLSKYTNSAFQNCFILIEYGLISNLFIILIPSNKHKIISLAIGFIMFFLLNSIFWQSILKYQSNTRTAEAIIFIGYSILYLKKLREGIPVEDPLRYAPFWIAVAFLCYYSLLLILSALDAYLYSVLPIEGQALMWLFRSCFDIMKYGLLLKALQVSGKEKYTAYGSLAF